MPGKDPVDVAVLPVQQLVHLLVVAVSRGLDELLGHVARDVCLKELLEEGGQAL
jgi:hypothetical protein